MAYLDHLFSLEGKTAIVTGASRGLGRAAAVALAGAGAKVVLVGRDRAALEEVHAEIASKVSTLSTIFEADVKDASRMMEIIASTINEWGKIDILVNNAGQGMWFLELSELRIYDAFTGQ